MRQQQRQVDTIYFSFVIFFCILLFIWCSNVNSGGGGFRRQWSLTDGCLFNAFTEEPIAREDTTLKDDGEEDAVDEDQKDEQTEAVAVEVTSEQPRSLGMERVYKYQPTHL